MKEIIAIAQEWRPDLIHVHGTENFYGLVPAQLSEQVPSVISLQGILAGYKPYAFGELSLKEVLRHDGPVNVLRMTGLLGTAWRWRTGSKIESEIFKQHSSFIGRTAWDREWTQRLNPVANYYIGEEILRNEFYDINWAVSAATRHTLFFSNLAGPHKGGLTVLEAMSKLISKYPTLRFRAAGRISNRSAYGRIFVDRIVKLGLSDHVSFIGFQSAAGLARELSNAHAFVSASFIDNSPNSISEAMLVGTPVIASSVGGVPSMIDPDKEGLLFPRGNVDALASAIDRIFRDDQLAERLSSNARARARQTHDPLTVVEQLRKVYESLLAPGLRL